MVAFLAFLVAETGLVIRRDWLRPLLAVSTTGMITVGLLLVKPPLWVDGLVTLGILVGVWWIYRPIARRGSPGGSAVLSEMMVSSREKKVISMGRTGGAPDTEG